MNRSSAFTDFERAVHDRIAPGYHAAFTPVTERAHPFLLTGAAVGAGDRVLDVATGPGLLAARAAGLGAVATGVDLSPRMVELAANLHPQAAFRVADAEALPFGDGSFDVVLCNFGIGHFPAPEKAFAEFARVLAPGGRLAVSWWEGPARSRINGLFFEVLQEEGIPIPDSLPPGPGAFHFSDDDVLRAAFADAGFRDVSIVGHADIHDLPDFDALWSLARNSFARLGTIIAGLGEEERERFRRAAAAKAAAYGGSRLSVPIAFKIAAGTA
ncbi:class I SAM-dependent methyltransferase [Labrys monachus]|uniref:SAM-dependent methyltransferase n=1 Tax=Labrys monachus TaxID=217067 RepID=A0ABU0FIR0_9HYPH|nr:class I SAM-dependent methyltransferase [Labrys monachus]MDQ0394366.1 SAM-dependent methyltransferase [Labrys monachus]